MKDSAVIETIEIFMEFVIMKTVIMRKPMTRIFKTAIKCLRTLKSPFTSSIIKKLMNGVSANNANNNFVCIVKLCMDEKKSSFIFRKNLGIQIPPAI